MKEVIALYHEMFGLIPKSARRFLGIYSVVMGVLALIDGLALGLLAMIITPLISGVPLTLPLFGKIEGTALIWPLLVVCALIVLKGVAALGLQWIATRRFATYELDLGTRVFDGYIRAPWVERLRRNSSDLVRISDASVNTTISGFILPGVSLLGEAMSFFALLGVLAIAEPMVGLVSLVYLGFIALFLQFQISRRSRQAGQVALRFSLRSARLITEMIGALKEVTLRGSAVEVADVVRSNRARTTQARANSQFLALVPRYVLDVAIIGGILLVGVTGYFTNGGMTGAVSSVALFGLAGFRLAPSLIRLQGVITQLNVAAPHARAVLEEVRRSEKYVANSEIADAVEFPAHPAALQITGVSFAYADDAPNAVEDVTLTIPFGTHVAFVGQSGAGKSTIVDLLLSLIDPTEGDIAIDGVPLTDIRDGWRHRIAYVPQTVSLFDATVAQNVALTWKEEFDRERVETALRKAQVWDIIALREGGIEGRVGEGGMSLSGGQRQRLGIARALYSDPLVLVLDEATSALDTKTEAAVTAAIGELQGQVTTITVAHRLSTVRHADQIFYMKDGRVLAHGTFDDVVKNVPEFALQAALAGLIESADDVIPAQD